MPATSQSFFKVSEKSESYLKQKIARFDNGDILLGDSSLEPLENGGTDGEVILTRMDECGNETWTYSYIVPEGYLEFKDFKVNKADEIFVYGTYYIGLTELVFLLKVNGQTGEELDFRYFNTGTVDHFAYNLILKDSKIYLYGLILDFGTQKQGFIARFNDNLNFEWGKKIEPFESTGFLIASSDGNFVGWSGDFVFKISNTGIILWSFDIETDENIHPIGGPLEVADGYIFESHGAGKSFFYKLSFSGQLIWVSDEFESTKFETALSLLPNGEILCTYNKPTNEYNELNQNLLEANTGNFRANTTLELDFIKNTGRIYQSFDPKTELLTIAANANPISIAPVDLKDFVLQYDLTNIDTFCLNTAAGMTSTTFNRPLDFQPFNFEVEDFEMVFVDRPNIEAINNSFDYNENCSIEPPTLQIMFDTLLECEATWLVTLPSSEYVWLDFSLENPRELDEKGTYKARKKDCQNPEVLTYVLDKPECECPIYFPNVFSPNNDGINDEYFFFTDCILEEFELNIFSRWGDIVYQSRTLAKTWDGKFKGEDLNPGVYVAIFNYTYLTNAGEMKSAKLVQDITLLR